MSYELFGTVEQFIVKCQVDIGGIVLECLISLSSNFPKKSVENIRLLPAKNWHCLIERCPSIQRPVQLNPENANLFISYCGIFLQ